MQQITAAITAVGGYVPEYRLTNKILETLVDTNDEWIKSRTGIEERRILKGEGLGSSDMGAEAVKQLLSKRGIDPSEIDCVICATVTPDMVLKLRFQRHLKYEEFLYDLNKYEDLVY